MNQEVHSAVRAHHLRFISERSEEINRKGMMGVADYGERRFLG